MKLDLGVFHQVFSEGYYITTGKALKSDFEKYSVSTLYILNGWI